MAEGPLIEHLRRCRINHADSVGKTVGLMIANDDALLVTFRDGTFICRALHSDWEYDNCIHSWHEDDIQDVLQFGDQVLIACGLATKELAASHRAYLSEQYQRQGWSDQQAAELMERRELERLKAKYEAQKV